MCTVHVFWYLKSNSAATITVKMTAPETTQEMLCVFDSCYWLIFWQQDIHIYKGYTFFWLLFFSYLSTLIVPSLTEPIAASSPRDCHLPSLSSLSEWKLGRQLMRWPTRLHLYEEKCRRALWWRHRAKHWLQNCTFTLWFWSDYCVLRKRVIYSSEIKGER